MPSIRPYHMIDPMMSSTPTMYGSAGEPQLGSMPNIDPYHGGHSLQGGGASIMPFLLMGGALGSLYSKDAGAPEPQKPAFDNNFNTVLNPDQEAQFTQWKQKYAPHDSGADYDLRGAFKAGLMPDPKTGHWDDTFKKPNHPTFSTFSQYAQFGLPGRWEGDNYIQHIDRPLDIIDDGMKFGDAFNQARKRGLVQFSWRGKSYTTEVK